MNVLDKLSERFQDVFFNTEMYLDPVFWMVCLILILWLMSACWASSIAESRDMHPKTHFLMGLLIPFIYPLRFRASGVKVEKVKKKSLKLTGRSVPTSTVDRAVVEEEPDEDGMVKISWDENYFREFVTSEEEENPQGFILLVAGQEVVIRRVIECQPNLMIVEIRDENKKLKRLRIPYQKIESCGFLQ